MILIECIHGFISDPYYGMERELAAEFDLQLISDSIIRRLLFTSPLMPPGMWMEKTKQLSNDGLHPNKLGNVAFSKDVLFAIKQIYRE